MVHEFAHVKTSETLRFLSVFQDLHEQWALRAPPKKGGISREPLEREVVSSLSRWSRQRRDGGSAAGRDSEF